MKLKKLLTAALALSLTASFAGCGGSSDSAAAASSAAEGTASASSSAEETAEETEAAAETDGEASDLIVFAAASTTETLEEIKTMYESTHEDINIVYNFDSSGTLKTQIQEGADCDLFISAGQLQMNQLDITAYESVNEEGLDFVIADTRCDLLENKVTLVVPEGNPKGVESFDDLASKLENGEVVMAMGNSDVPVGQYTQKIFEYYGLDENALASAGSLTYGTNVKEVTTQVSESSVDCGIVYCTDAYSAGLEVVDYATADMCGQVIYPAAVLNVSQNQEAAEEFLEYLKTDEAMAVFEEVGFSAAAE